MKRLIEFQLADGDKIYVEVEETGEGGMVPASRGGRSVTDKADKARKTFEDALDKIRPAAATIIGKLRDLHDPPDEIEVEFGLKMNAEFGAVVAATGMEANYKVTLKWER